jgi:hypothetical protein
MHREFRFPRLGILAMFLALLSVIVAIEQTRSVASGGSGDQTALVVRLIPVAIGVIVIAGLVGYLNLRVLRRLRQR